MANVDRPNGFRAVKTLSGRPVTQLVRSVGVADGTDIFLGDALVLSSGLATPMATNGSCLGVAVGFGKKNDLSNKYNMYDPTSLDVPNYYDDSASTHTEWQVFYLPANDVIFEAQTDAAVTLAVGDTRDILATAGSATTGLSAMEIDEDGTTNSDLIVVEVPDIVGNDHTLAAGRYWVMFTDVALAQA